MCKIIENHIIIISICLLVILYIVMNYDNIYNGVFNYRMVIKPILITAIISIILYMYATWDVKHTSVSNIPKENIKIDDFDLFDYNNKTANMFGGKQELTPKNLGDKNIFISQKQIAKYGIKI